MAQYVMLKFHFIFNILRSIKNILWSFLDPSNRKNFTIMLRDYMGGVRQSQYLSSTPSKPYSAVTTHSGSSPKILLVVHELSRTGAPYAVLYLGRAFFSIHGIRPVIVSPKDGPIKEEFIQEGFTVIVDPLLFNYRYYSMEPCNFVASFDRVIVTSIASFNFIRYFRGISNHLTWWIHETGLGFSLASKMGADLPLLFAACESIWLGSPLCLSPASQYASPNKLHLLLYGCPDAYKPALPQQTEKITFSLIGSVEERKGQDIFLDAIELLPEGVRKKADFRIIGSPLPNNKSATFHKNICAKAARIPEVACFPNMPYDRLQDFYSGSSVFVSASRDDPMPIAITHGLMFSKVCLCSSAIGQAQLLVDGKDGLIFTNESAADLSEKMAWLIQNPAKLSVIGTEGRRLYEKYFLMSSFEDNLNELILNRRESVLSNTEP